MRFIPLPPSYCEAWDFRTSSRESRDEVIPSQSKPLPRTPQTKLTACTKTTSGWWMAWLCWTILCSIYHHQLIITERHGIDFSSHQELWDGRIIRLLIQLLFTSPVSDAASERIFSSFGRVSKTKRASLSQRTLQDILRNQEEGTLMETYDPSKAVMGWNSAKPRWPNQKTR